MGHVLYTTNSPDKPDVICDSNGDVVLGLCRVCGKGESELVLACTVLGQADEAAAVFTADKLEKFCKREAD